MGDTILPILAVGRVTFARSYPARIPRSGAVVWRNDEPGTRYSFTRLHEDFGIPNHHAASICVQHSAQRYIGRVSGACHHLT